MKNWIRDLEKTLLADAELVRARLISSDSKIEEIKGDDGDLAQAIYRAQLSARFQGRDLKLLQKIEQAVLKIHTGTFGICEECEEPISQKRLQARPVTTLCVNCKEFQEKHEGTFSEI